MLKSPIKSHLKAYFLSIIKTPIFNESLDTTYILHLTEKSNRFTAKFLLKKVLFGITLEDNYEQPDFTKLFLGYVLPRIAQSVIDEITQLNIKDIIAPHVDLVSKGRTTMGLCPFHSEKTPSFYVHEDKGFFKCFGCNAVGNGIQFIQKHLTLDFHDAIAYICEQFNMELRYESGKTPQKPVKELNALHEMFAERAKTSLFNTEGAFALKYLTKRGFTEDIIKQFGLGWVPPNINTAPFEKSFPRNILTESGIFKDTTYYGLKCFFADRILFPIRNATGTCIAFSGRAINPDAQAKYKNSSFSKGSALYNLHNAKDAIKNNKSCFIVEGYFDAIRMAAAGYPQTVAIMGTAFTRDQIAQLKRYDVEEYNLILDGDKAGIDAMIKSRDIALECDIYPNVIFLPAGEDPDSYLKTNEKAAFDIILKTRRDLLLYTIEKEHGSGTDANRLFHCLDRIKKILARIKNPYRRDYYIKEAASAFEVSEETLHADVNTGRTKVTATAYVKKAHNINHVVEKEFITYLLRMSKETVRQMISGLREEYFDDETFRLIYKKIVELSAQDGNINSLSNDSDVGKTITDLILHHYDTHDYNKAALDCKNKLLINYDNKERNKLANEIKSSGDLDNLDAYYKQLRDISKHQRKTYRREE